MDLLTTSSVRCYRSCPRLYHIQYELGIRPVKKAHALFFGDLIHQALEVWWANLGRVDGDTLLNIAQAAMRGKSEDPFDAAVADVLIWGYHHRYHDKSERVQTQETEKHFKVTLRNPRTGRPSQKFKLGGKRDAKALINSRPFLIEHKTSSEDITQGSAYWEKLLIDSQISNYITSLIEAGDDVEGCLYDVIKKPTMKPRLATPEDKRYKTDGEMRKGARDHDETPAEFAQRLADDIELNPDKYYQRKVVVRLEGELRASQDDIWMTAKQVHQSRKHAIWPRNDSYCFKWQRACSFFGVCTGTEQLTDQRFEKLDSVHPELT